MPPEPKKPIEELLEASAKARRVEFGPDPAMPNPMRARLHDEIARVARTDEPKTGARWMAWWPRFVIGAAAAAILIGAPLLWWRTPQVAMNQPVAANETSRAKIQPAPAQSDTAVSAKAPSESFPDNTEAKSAGLAKSGGDDSAALKKYGDVAIAPTTQAPGGSDEKAEAKPLAAPALARAGKTETDNFNRQASRNHSRQSFRDVAKLQPAGKVLRAFQVEQTGLDIRVVDADGSTYIGKIELVAQNAAELQRAEKENFKARAEPGAAPPKPEANPGSNQFSFRATGYSDRLKKTLVFEGNYIVTSPLHGQAASPTDANKQRLSARIVGTVQIQGEPPAHIDAVSVAP